MLSFTGNSRRNVTYNRTEFMAVRITVLDKDPQMAADIANKIAELLDSAKNEILHQRAIEGFRIFQAEYNQSQSEINRIADSIVALGKLGINDVQYQSQVLNQEMAIAIVNGKKSAIDQLQKKLDILGKYGGVYLSLKDALKYKTEQLSILQIKFKEAKMDAEANLPQKFIVNEAFKAEEKFYPVQWLIILVSAFSALLLAVIVLIVIEKITVYNSHKKFNVG